MDATDTHAARAEAIELLVPTKNAVPYLPRLIASFGAQTDPAFRVMFIDDGSTDETVAECARISDRFGVVATMKSSLGAGPGAARNLGLQTTTASYVSFVDADDYVHPRYVEELRSRTESHPDIVESLFCALDEQGHIISKSNIAIHLNTSQRIPQLLDGKMSMVSWGKLYRTQFLRERNVCFPENVHNGEDHIFTLHAYKAATEVQVCLLYLYFWCRRTDSLTKREVDIRMIDDLFKVSQMKLDIAESLASADFVAKTSARILSETKALQKRISEGSMAEKNFLLAAFKSRMKLLVQHNSHLVRHVPRSKPSFIFGRTRPQQTAGAKK